MVKSLLYSHQNSRLRGAMVKSLLYSRQNSGLWRLHQQLGEGLTLFLVEERPSWKPKKRKGKGLTLFHRGKSC